jgi:hypothetical protein
MNEENGFAKKLGSVTVSKCFQALRLWSSKYALNLETTRDSELKTLGHMISGNYSIKTG